MILYDWSEERGPKPIPKIGNEFWIVLRWFHLIGGKLLDAERGNDSALQHTTMAETQI